MAKTRSLQSIKNMFYNLYKAGSEDNMRSRVSSSKVDSNINSNINVTCKRIRTLDDSTKHRAGRKRRATAYLNMGKPTAPVWTSSPWTSTLSSLSGNVASDSRSDARDEDSLDELVDWADHVRALGGAREESDTRHNPPDSCPRPMSTATPRTEMPSPSCLGLLSTNGVQGVQGNVSPPPPPRSAARPAWKVESSDEFILRSFYPREWSAGIDAPCAGAGMAYLGAKEEGDIESVRWRMFAADSCWGGTSATGSPSSCGKIDDSAEELPSPSKKRSRDEIEYDGDDEGWEQDSDLEGYKSEDGESWRRGSSNEGKRRRG